MAEDKQYTKEERIAIVEAICDRVVLEQISFNQAIKESTINLMSFYRWVAKYEELQPCYNYAREIRSDTLFEEIVNIADSVNDDIIHTENGPVENHHVINRDRLRIDARKWVVAKMQPKKYGDKMEVEQTGSIEIVVKPPQFD